MPKHEGYILAAKHFSMDIARFITLKFGFYTYTVYFMTGDPLDFGHSFRATVANLSQSLRIKSTIWRLDLRTYTYHLSLSIFAFAIFREPAFSFRAGTPDQPSDKSKCGRSFS